MYCGRVSDNKTRDIIFMFRTTTGYECRADIHELFYMRTYYTKYTMKRQQKLYYDYFIELPTCTFFFSSHWSLNGFCKHNKLKRKQQRKNLYFVLCSIFKHLSNKFTHYLYYLILVVVPDTVFVSCILYWEYIIL